MLKKAVVALGVAVLLLLGGAMRLPRERHVQRAITIEAPGANVYTLLESRHEVTEAKRFSSFSTRLDVAGRGAMPARFTLSPDGRGTRVVESIDLDMGAGPVGRVSGWLLDRRLSADLGRGLAEVKALAETMPKTDVSALVADVVEARGGRAVRAIHRGAYASLPVTYEQLRAYLALRGLETAGASWEEHVSDPAVTQEPDLITNVYQPVK